MDFSANKKTRKMGAWAKHRGSAKRANSEKSNLLMGRKRLKNVIGCT
jgi:hypothetical protein